MEKRMKQDSVSDSVSDSVAGTGAGDPAIPKKPARGRNRRRDQQRAGWPRVSTDSAPSRGAGTRHLSFLSEAQLNLAGPGLFRRTPSGVRGDLALAQSHGVRHRESRFVWWPQEGGHVSRDLYDVLGVPGTASEAEIRRAFCALAKSYHPDVNRGSPDAARRFVEVGNAADFLLDPRRRAS